MTDLDYINNVVPNKDKMFRFACTIIGNRSAAEDIVHDILEKIWKKRWRLDDYCNLSAFLMVSVRNACYDYLRHSKLSENFINDNCIVNEDNANWDIRRLILRAINSLPDRQREIVHLKDIEGYETAEIAIITNLDENHVRTILSRARKSLKITIEKFMNYGTT